VNVNEDYRDASGPGVRRDLTIEAFSSVPGDVKTVVRGLGNENTVKMERKNCVFRDGNINLDFVRRKSARD